MGSWGGRRAQRLTSLTLAQYGTECWLRWDDGCTSVATTADHIIPRKHGGDDALENLRPACLHCNSARGARPLSARPRRFVVVDGLDFFSEAASEATRQPSHFSPPLKQISDHNPADQDDTFAWFTTPERTQR